MKAITTKFIGPTDTKPARVVAKAEGVASHTVSWDHALDQDDNHERAARELALRMEWVDLKGRDEHAAFAEDYCAGTLPDGSTRAFVCLTGHYARASRVRSARRELHAIAWYNALPAWLKTELQLICSWLESDALPSVLTFYQDEEPKDALAAARELRNVFQDSRHVLTRRLEDEDIVHGRTVVAEMLASYEEKA